MPPAEFVSLCPQPVKDLCQGSLRVSISQYDATATGRQLAAEVESRCRFCLPTFAMRDRNSIRRRYSYLIDDRCHIHIAILEHPVCTPNRPDSACRKLCIDSAGCQSCHAGDFGCGKDGA
jgi:hypothetical protein